MKTLSLKGFTLIELLVVLILTGILMSLVSGMFYYLFVYQKQIETKATPIETIHRLDYLVRLDMERSERVIFEKEIITMKLPADTVFYELNEDYILRRQKQVTDTFAISNTVGNLKIRNGFLTGFEWSLTYGPGVTIRHIYHKTYDRATFY